MAAQTQFYRTWMKIGGAFYPVLPGTLRFTFPENMIIPPIIGNYWSFNYAKGLQVPIVEAQFAVLDNATSVLSSTFLNYFHTRSNDVAHDTTAIGGGIEIFQGRRGVTIGGIKADAYTVGSAKGEACRFTGRFCGTTVTEFDNTALTAALTAFTAGGGWTKECLISYKNVSFAGVLANEVWNFNLSFSNNHTPDMALNGLTTPAAQNAGMQSAGLSFLTQAAITPALVLPNNGSCPPPVTPDTIALSIAGSVVARTFTFNNPVYNDRTSINIPAGRVMQEHSVVGLGANGITTPPLSIS